MTPEEERRLLTKLENVEADLLEVTKDRDALLAACKAAYIELRLASCVQLLLKRAIGKGA